MKNLISQYISDYMVWRLPIHTHVWLMLTIGLVCIIPPVWSQTEDPIIEVQPATYDPETARYDETGEEHKTTDAVFFHETPPVQTRPISAEQWDKAARNLDYSKDQPSERKDPTAKMPDVSDWNFETAGLGTVMQAIAIALILGLIAYGIFKMAIAPRNKQIAKDGVEITLENMENYVLESDLERFLREALQQGQYNVAIRVHYLMVIKHLNDSNAILWMREKTNRTYLNEMKNHPKFQPFKSATSTYEQVWYGNLDVSKDEYQSLKPTFELIHT